MKSYYFDSEAAVIIEQTDGIRYKNGSRIALGDFVVESPGQVIQAAGLSFLKSPLMLGVIEDESDTWGHGIKGFGAAGSYLSRKPRRYVKAASRRSSFHGKDARTQLRSSSLRFIKTCRLSICS